MYYLYFYEQICTLNYCIIILLNYYFFSYVCCVHECYIFKTKLLKQKAQNSKKQDKSSKT